MRTGLRLALSGLTLLAASCAAGTTREPEPPAPAVSIRFGKTPAFADLVEAEITVTNTTLEAVLVKAVDLEGQLPHFLDRPFSLPGRLEERRKEYLYDPQAPGETPPVFTGEWLLLPAESRSVSEWYRARSSPQKITIRFRRLPVEDLCGEAYFPAPDAAQKRRLRFRRIVQSRLNDYRRAEPGTPERLLILPGEETWPVETAESTHQVFLPSPPDVEGRFGASAQSSITRWLGKQSWIVDDPLASKTFGIDEAGRRFDLPRCDLLVFDVLDLSPPGEPIPVYQKGSDEPLEQIPADGAMPFLDRARAQRHRLLPTWTETEDGRFLYGLLEN